MSTRATGLPGRTERDRRAVDSARVLAADALRRAASGRPGAVPSLVPAAYAIFQKVMCVTRPTPSDGPAPDAPGHRPVRERRPAPHGLTLTRQGVPAYASAPDVFRERVLPPSVRSRAAVEAGAALTGYRFVGDAGRIVSLGRFGAFAAAGTPSAEFGLTAENVAAAARESLAAVRG
ncbi:hypothetical protein WN71_027220 [Streptomyces mangrovisoli]|uniref:Uncharacterized protein n=1 Tax=Streptomyces mangrovisoli TaxID=1428628 RepID=A0A1J4NQR9_9ACTN|nr:hypothetical protein WN71_027220 [Streptomyces mangrovisoli]